MAECVLYGNGNSGASTGFNFEVVGGASAPASPKVNTIWVNTDTAISSWYFSADEPNVCQATVPDASDPWTLSIPHTLHEGDILNFTIPAAVSSTFEAIRIYDGSGKLYFVRSFGGAAVTGWYAGTKVGFVISNTSYPIGDWGSDGGSARLYKWDDYHHNEGTVWIQTGKSSPVEFNALKKNGFMVYPISAKQYVGSAWVDKTAKSYQSGAWVDWILYLYKDGSTYDGLTGGYETVTGDFTFESDHIYVYQGGARTPVCYTKQKIDLTNISTLYLEIDKLTTNSYTTITLYFIVADNQKTISTDFTTDIVRTEYNCAKSMTDVSLTLTLDVSQVIGEHYINFGSRSTGSGAKGSYNITEIRGEA